MMRRFIYILLVSCTPDVPETPSFQQDVQPILAANCVRCHSTEPLSAPAYIRLDTYDDLELRAADLAETDPICMENKEDPRCISEVLQGAESYAETIAMRIVDEERPMPPRFGLDSYQIEILQRWAAARDPDDTEALRGRPRRDNQLPTARIDAIDGTVIDIVVSDPDRDLVGGALLVDVGPKELVIGAIAGGRMQLTWDAEDVVPGTHALRAEIDDGAGVVSVELGTITVEAP